MKYFVLQYVNYVLCVKKLKLNFSTVKNKVSESLSKEFFKSQVSFINSDYGNSRHVSYRCNLDVGKYLLMATTYEPGEESGKFLNFYLCNFKS